MSTAIALKNSLSSSQLNFEQIEARLLAWYDAQGRELPWRLKNPQNNERPNPYFVWISEIMLQQTTVAAVKPYFLRFIEHFADVHSLASAPIDQVLHLWQGLGYYSRAHNLHKCANIISEQLGGIFPTSEIELLKLPGIGTYTAAAIASIAYDAPTLPVDGNIIRVISRILAIETPMPALKKLIEDVIKNFIPSSRSGDFAQALMDLGATICQPKSPLCLSCPLNQNCEAYRNGIAEILPRPAEKPIKQIRYGTIFWILNEEGQILIRKRMEKGLLHGLMEFPSTPWIGVPWAKNEALKHMPIIGDYNLTYTGETVRHVFTHFTLNLEIVIVKFKNIPQREISPEAVWTNAQAFSQFAFPNLMQKVIKKMDT